MNKQELIEHIGNTLDKCLKNTTFIKPVLSITEIAKSDEVSLEFKIGKSCILLDDVSYQFGYDKGKLDGEWVGQQLKDADKIRQELNKPVVPQFVANWYEKHKYNFEFNMWDYVYRFDTQEDTSFKKWLNGSKTESFKTLVNMHQFGYTVEKEKRYLVKIKNIDSDYCYLKRVKSKWIINESYELPQMYIHVKHTRKELEEAGFGEVFSSPLFEVEEVKG